MKKILLASILLFYLFSFDLSYSNCTPPNWDFDITWALENCLSNSDLVEWAADLEYWFSWTLKEWINNISVFLWIWAVLWIVYGSFMLTISTWEDEKVNKAKWIIKWSIIGFIWLIMSFFIINLIIRLFYSLI